jgi:hypothetical protein
MMDKTFRIASSFSEIGFIWRRALLPSTVFYRPEGNLLQVHARWTQRFPGPDDGGRRRRRPTWLEEGAIDEKNPTAV